jgi:hypothetical protein
VQQALSHVATNVVSRNLHAARKNKAELYGETPQQQAISYGERATSKGFPFLQEIKNADCHAIFKMSYGTLFSQAEIALRADYKDVAVTAFFDALDGRVRNYWTLATHIWDEQLQQLITLATMDVPKEYSENEIIHVHYWTAVDYTLRLHVEYTTAREKEAGKTAMTYNFADNSTIRFRPATFCTDEATYVTMRTLHLHMTY